MFPGKSVAKLKITPVCKMKHSSIWSKALLMPLTIWNFCLVLHLTNTSVDAKSAVKWQPSLLPGVLVLLPTLHQ